MYNKFVDKEVSNLIDEKLNNIIEEKCENRNIYQYILKSLEYFKSKNYTFYNYLCNSIFDLLSTYQDFKFICADFSYFSSSKCELAISQKNIEVGDYTTLIHEITHAIHGLQHSYNIPSEYEYLRNQLMSNDNFKGLVRDLMTYIIQSKKANSLKARLFNNKINKMDTNKIYNINYDVKFTSKNNTFKIVDNIKYNTFNGEEFPVLSAMESMIDSILTGGLYSGYKSDCFYLEGWGHKKEYFEEDLDKSFLELIADYAVLIAYNNSTLIEKMEKIIGEEMSDLLRTSLNSMICKENTNCQRR